MDISIAIETPLQDDVRALLAELNAAISAQEPDTPEEFNFRMTAEEMAGPETTVWVVRQGGAAVGCGALMRHPDGLGEVKRMFLRPAVQGQGIAGLILRAIEDLAQTEGIERLALETGGDGYAGARRLYERNGFVRRGPFADYPDNPYSVFYEKTLSRKTAT